MCHRRDLQQLLVGRSAKCPAPGWSLLSSVLRNERRSAHTHVSCPRRVTIGQTPTRSRASALAGRLSEGIPGVFVAALAALALAGILYTIASREPYRPTGYADFTMFREGCLLDPAKRLNVSTCESIGPGLYRLTFSRRIDRSVIVATRSTCCPGRISAGVQSHTTALVQVERRVRRPIRASVLAP
jgi:hypothetical protein